VVAALVTRLGIGRHVTARLRRGGREAKAPNTNSIQDLLTAAELCDYFPVPGQIILERSALVVDEIDSAPSLGASHQGSLLSYPGPKTRPESRKRKAHEHPASNDISKHRKHIVYDESSIQESPTSIDYPSDPVACVNAQGNERAAGESDYTIQECLQTSAHEFQIFTTENMLILV